MKEIIDKISAERELAGMLPFPGGRKIHRLAWDAFTEGTRIAREQGLYGAGQDLLKDAFSGNVKGLGPAVAEMKFTERPNGPFVFCQADKTDPGAYNLPLYLAFADPLWCPGLILSPKTTQGFRFTILDVFHTEADRCIELTRQRVSTTSPLCSGTPHGS